MTRSGMKYAEGLKPSGKLNTVTIQRGLQPGQQVYRDPSSKSLGIPTTRTQRLWLPKIPIYYYSLQITISKSIVINNANIYIYIFMDKKLLQILPGSKYI